jgi:hypothetical protein
MRKQLISTSLLLLLAQLIFAQWECPSQLGAYLKPVGQTNFYWSGELTGGAGYITNNSIANAMGLIGLDWSSKKSSFYIEGGFKYWNRKNFDTSSDYSNRHFGLRELYYQYKSQQSNLTLGIQSARLDDDFLLNERIVGANIRINSGKWSLNALGGSVTKDFARNGTFCNVGYLYDILQGRSRALIGNSFGQTNLASFSVKYQPSKAISKTKKASSGDEFTTDEFSNGLNSSPESKHGSFKLESVGAITYHEFGNWITQQFVTTGLFAQTEWGKNWGFKPEILFQSATGNKALIYNFQLEKTIEAAKTKTTFTLRYIGKTNIDSNAKILNSFSNIFAGDVIRLDAVDGSFLQAGVKCSFPESKIHLKAQFASKVSGSEMRETDFEVGKKFGKRLQINALSGLVNSYLLTDKALMGRIEFRYYF